MLKYINCDLGMRGPAGVDGSNGDVGPKGNTVIHSTCHLSVHTKCEERRIGFGQTN